ncbi:hypothetical protein CPC08DRAFT_628437 [Agrocybe pediades]|nr:hypothetical protein CPC08DRAFT_628437 [Agrocybe pediades]
MPVRCSECGASTTWDDDVGSAVCTSCGSLVDPSQSVLTSSLYGLQNDAVEPSLWDGSAASTLKSLRSGNNWDLAGQGKETRDRKNAYAMSEFIKSLALSLDAAGLSPRVITLFNQAKSTLNFRWGQKSKAVSAACLAIALREANRPDSLRDIASVLDIPPTSVIREFTAITSTLKLSLTLVDPSVHIPTIQAHINSILELSPEESGLPKSLVTTLGKLCFYDVVNSAHSLSRVLARLSPEHDLLRLPMPPTACGIFMLAMEGENRTPLNSLGDLAQCLGSRCHSSKGVVMARYKTLQDEVASWMEELPWLDKYESKKGRAKVSKRLLVARGIKDVICFHEDIWRKKKMPTLELDLDSEESVQATSNPESNDASTRPHKRPRLNHPLNQATQFLLHPLGTPATSKDKTFNIPSHLALAAYLLGDTSGTRYPPTRLQLLAHHRGGADDAHIPDEELFAEGEFEKLLRNENEIQVLRQTFGWKEGEDEEQTPSTTRTRKQRKPQASPSVDDEILHGTALSPRKKSRLNMEALAKLLSSNGEEDISEEEEERVNTTLLALGDAVESEDDEDDESMYALLDSNTNNTAVSSHSGVSRTITNPIIHDDEVILENWRPPTPEYNASDSRYEEEYD